MTGFHAERVRRHQLEVVGGEKDGLRKELHGVGPTRPTGGQRPHDGVCATSRGGVKRRGPEIDGLGVGAPVVEVTWLDGCQRFRGGRKRVAWRVDVREGQCELC